VRYPGEPLSFEASPAQQEPQHSLARVEEASAKMAQKIAEYQRRGTPVATASLWSHVPQSRTPAIFFQDAVAKNLLICVKAGLLERVHTVKAQGRGKRS
jgi:hypothetical protein